MRPPRRSGRSSSARGARGAGVSGRSTTPVGGVGVAGVELVSDLLVSDDSGRLGSRPRNTRERLRSSSNGTPGVLSVAPVRPSGISITGIIGALTDPSRRGRSMRPGSESTTRRAIGSSAARPRRSPLPKSPRGTLVTPRHLGSLSSRR